MRALVALLFLLACACRTMTPDEYARVELSMLPVGVDLSREESAVRRSLRQRHLDVVDEVRGEGFVALGAESLDGRLSAVRVITGRGVVVAEDGARDDLFAPSSVALVTDFGPAVHNAQWVALTRTPAGAELGCLALFRVDPDANAVRAVLDLTPLGSRACLAGLARDEGGRVRAVLAFPTLTALVTPAFEVALSFAEPLPGRPAERIPVIRIAPAGPWLDEERARVDALPGEGPFSQRHALGVVRAALAQLAGLDQATQVGLYSQAVGRVLPGSYEAEVSHDAADHIKRGWLELDQVVAAEGDGAVPEDATVIEPGEAAPAP